MKKIMACVCAAAIMMSEASIYAKTYTNEVSGESVSSVQGENGWEYLMEHNGIFLQMPKYSSVVTPTWRSGKDYPYVDGKTFFPSTDWSAVKKWTAYADCVVDICGDVIVRGKTTDGVKAIIKKDNDVLWSGDVQSSCSVDNVKNISVSKGQSIYFIVKANENMSGDKTEWTPKISCKIEAEKPAESAIDIGSAVLSGGCTLSGDQISGFGNGEYFIIKNVDLFDGYKTLGIKLKADNTGDSFEVRLNSKYGKKIADGIVCATNGASEYQYFEFNENVIGENDICFVSDSGNGISEISEIKLMDREPFGATPGFETIEAENAALGGTAEIHNLKNYDVPQTSGDSRDGNNYNRMQKAVQAASNKSYVDLSHIGDYIEFTAPQNANRVVLRYTIPKNTKGTLSLYVNDYKRTIELSSDYNYDSNSNYYMRSFDDKLLAVNLSEGDKLKLQVDSDNTLEYYGIDLVDFEYIASPVSMNDNCISIAEYGATPNDDSDDTEAIKMTLDAAKLLGMDVYIPEGRFIQTSRLTIPSGVNICGAGMWYSEIYCPTRSYGKGAWGGKIGYYLGTDTDISDVMISGNSRYREDSGIAIMGQNYGDGESCSLNRVWFRNMTTAMGWTNWSDSEITNCRFTGIYADAIHFGDGPQQNNKAVNNYIRGCGDDGIAVVTRKDYTEDKNLKAQNVTAQFNSIIASYWGRDMSIVGGSNVVYTNNIMNGSVNAGLMISTEELSPSYSVKNENIKVQRNIIKNVSNRLFHHAGIHFDLSYNGIENGVFELNRISDTGSCAIWIDDTPYGDNGMVQINYNIVSNIGWTPPYRNRSSVFTPVLKGNSGF